MKAITKVFWPALALIGALGLATTASSADAPDAAQMLGAVVKVHSKSIEDARSNATLGRTREGTGVVIDDKGHVLTVGYIVI
ncbi:MAG: hypothetical protein NT115_02590, partial [Proteobacteria bacterium]|nr:hypothetical protein [Pseudomonadota bacterium]